MYKIGELSKLSQIPVKTLRFYDAEGILVPDEIDEFTGYRYYGAAKHEGTEYLFVQWKSGDYSYGGEQPFWYVFKR